MQIVAMLAIMVIAAFMMVALTTWLLKWYRKAKPDHAIVHYMRQATFIKFNGALEIPVITRIEYVYIAARSISLSFKDRDSLAFQDGKHANLDCTVYLSLGRNEANIQEAIEHIGIERLNDEVKLSSFLNPKLIKLLRETAMELSINGAEKELGERVKEKCTNNFYGFNLDDVAITQLEAAD